jgi:hypothetical protein
VERLTVLLLVLAGALVACAPEGRQKYDSWNQAFANRPVRFGQAVTALWIARYQEDPQTKQFERSSAWGEIPEKLVPDGQGGYTVAVPLLWQGESSDGPLPDRFWTVLVRVVRTGEQFTLAPNDDLPGEVVGWHDEARRTVWFRGRQLGSPQTLWQFQGRY